MRKSAIFILGVVCAPLALFGASGCEGATGLGGARCDDGSLAACRMVQPECDLGTILAVQNNCWACVDPKTCEEPTVGPATLHLYVSNQSFDIDPVHIRVIVDGHTVVNDTFLVEGQHNWVYHEINLGAGLHTLRVESDGSPATYEGTFTLVDEHYAVVDFWYYPDSHYDPTDEQFSWHFSDDPLGFD